MIRYYFYVVFAFNYLFLTDCKFVRGVDYFPDPVVHHEWAEVEYDWISPEQRDTYLQNGWFIPKNNAITGIKVYKGEIYVAVPRWLPGVPSTLNKVITKNGTSLLQPYPSWEMQRIGDPNALQYVQSMEIDSRGWMWILDVGQVNINVPSLKVPGPPSIVIWDMNKNCSVKEYIFPNHVLAWNNSFANDIVLDQARGFAYISNTVETGGIAIYDFNANEARLWTDKATMTATPHNVTINGTPFFLTLGTDGISLSADTETLFYKSVSADKLFGIYTRYLIQKPYLTNQELAGKVNHFPVTGYSDGMTYDDAGNLYYGDLVKNAVYSWKPGNSLPIIVAQNSSMVWPDTFAWDNDQKLLFFTTNKLHLFLLNKLDPTSVNFRIWSVAVDQESYLQAKSPSPPSLPCLLRSHWQNHLFSVGVSLPKTCKKICSNK